MKIKYFLIITTLSIIILIIHNTLYNNEDQNKYSNRILYNVKEEKITALDNKINTDDINNITEKEDITNTIKENNAIITTDNNKIPELSEQKTSNDNNANIVEEKNTLKENKETINFKKIAEIYSNMDPEDAAKQLDKIDIIYTIKIINNIETSKLSSILKHMEPKRVQEILLRSTEE